MAIFGKKKEKKGKGIIPIDKVKESLSKGLSKIEVIDKLRKDKFSADEIDKAMLEGTKSAVEKKEQTKESIFMPSMELEGIGKVKDDSGGLKEALESLKAIISNINELDRMRYEKMVSLQETIEIIDAKLANLGSRSSEPVEFQGELPPEEYSKGMENGRSTEVDKLIGELETSA